MVVALSGGVDSAVAAALLKRKGMQVVGLFAHLWEEKERAGKLNRRRCCSLPGWADAVRVAKALDIPLYTVNLVKQFRRRIVRSYLRAYAAGLTPNPCVICNEEIKFGLLREHALRLGAAYFATGHYARLRRGKNGKRHALLAARDRLHDQSYFLYRIPRGALSQLIFPVGKLRKSEVRQRAQQWGIPVAQKPSTQEVCFIRTRHPAPFLQKHLSLSPGPILTLDGKRLGTHRGLPLYTIGQRQGLGLSGGPWYVAAKELPTNTLRVVHARERGKITGAEFTVFSPRWLSPVRLPLRCRVRIRYLAKTVPCTVFREGGKQAVRVKLKQPLWAITPGQSAVFYRGEEVLGGGIIRIPESGSRFPVSSCRL